MKYVALALALLIPPGVSIADSAQSSDWTDVRPSVEISVSPTDLAGQFEVNATIKDIRSGQILSTPKLLTTAGHAAVIHVGSDAGAMVKLSVLVDPAASSATYTAEVLERNELISRHSASVTLVKPASGV